MQPVQQLKVGERSLKSRNCLWL